MAAVGRIEGQSRTPKQFKIKTGETETQGKTGETSTGMRKTEYKEYPNGKLVAGGRSVLKERPFAHPELPR